MNWNNLLSNKKPALAVTLAAMLAVTGCGAASKGSDAKSGEQPKAGTESKTPVEISFYQTGSLNVKEMWETVIPMFEKENANIKVKLVYIPTGQAGQSTLDRLTAAKKAGQKSVDIDLYEAGVNDLLIGQKEGLYTKLEAAKIPNIGKIEDKYMKDVSNQAIPYRASSVILAYNSKNVTTPPKTADELYEWIRKHPGKFAYNDPATGGSGSSFVTTAIYNFMAPETYNSQDPGVMAQWDKGFQLLKELGPYMYQKGVYPKKNQGTLDILASGEVDMIPAWSDMALENLNKKVFPDTIKLSQIQPAFTGGPAYLMVPELSEKKDAAYKFLDFVLKPEIQKVIVDKMYSYPGIKWSEMDADLQKRFESVSAGYRQIQIGGLSTELNKRWQKEVAGQ